MLSKKFRILRGLTFILIALFVVPLSISQGPSLGQDDEWKNIAVFSLTSTDKGAPMIKQILNATGHEGLLDDFEAQQREAFGVLDFSRPKGIVCQTNGRTFQFLGFAAMSDVTKLPYSIGELIANTETKRDGWYKIVLPNAKEMPLMFQNIYVKQQGDWAWVCYGALRPPTELPNDPTEWLEGLPEEFPVALRFNSAAVPQGQLSGMAMLGKQFLPMIKMFAPMGTGGEGEREIMAAYYSFLEVILAESIDQTVKFITETESMTLGLSGNENNDVLLTMQIVAKPNTDTAKALHMSKDNTTDLMGFFRPDDSIVSYVYAMPIPDYQKGYVKKTYIGTVDFFKAFVGIMRRQMEEYGPDEASEAFDKVDALLAKLPVVVEKTVDAGMMDFAISMTDNGTNLYGIKLAGGNELLEPANELFDFAQLMILQEVDSDDLTSVPVLERENYKGTQLWHFSVPMPRFMFNEDEVSEDEAPYVIAYVFGLNDELIIYSGGMFSKPGETLRLVKEAIDGSSEAKPVPEEWMVISPYRCAQMFKQLFTTFSPYDEEDEIEDNSKEFDRLWDFPEDANITATIEVEGDTMTQVFRIDGRLWPTFGRAIDRAIEDSDGEILAPFAPLMGL